jgi:hypothetical protein
VTAWREAPPGASTFARGLEELVLDVSVARDGDSLGPLRYVQLETRLHLREPHAQYPDGTPLGADARITDDQGGALIALLDERGLFTGARWYHSPRVQAPTTPPPAGSELGPTPAAAPPHARIEVRTIEGGWHVSAILLRPLDASTRALLESMAAAVEGDAATHLRALAAQLPSQ